MGWYEGTKQAEETEALIAKVFGLLEPFRDKSVLRPPLAFELDLDVDLNLDSLDLLEVIMSLEDEFEIEISDEEAGKLKRVVDLINITMKLTGMI